MNTTESGWPISPGRRVRLRVSIWDDGADCHPPGFLGKAGDVLQVYECRDGWVTVTHDHRPQSNNTFLARESEVELYWEQPDLFPDDLRFGQYRRGGLVPPDFTLNLRGLL